MQGGTPGHIRIPRPHVLPDAITIILPGWGVSPYEYVPLGEFIREDMSWNRIDTEVYVVKYTGNVMHNLQTRSRVRAVLDAHPGIPAYLVGHSQGGFCATAVCEEMGISGVVQYASHFNSVGNFPYTSTPIHSFATPYMTLLCELDESVSCSDAVKDLADVASKSVPLQLLTTLPYMHHKSGLEYRTNRHNEFMQRTVPVGFSDPEGRSAAPEGRVISWRISAYLAYVHTRDEGLGRGLEDAFRDTLAKYTPYLRETLPHGVSAWAQEKQREFSRSDAPVLCHHHAYPGNITLVILTATAPWTRCWLNLMHMLPRFVFSHGSSTPGEGTVVHSYTPHKYNVESLITRHITEKGHWVKLKSSPASSSVGAADLNRITFDKAIADVGDREKRAYENFGRSMVFEDDLRIPLVPFCSVMWLCTPMLFRYDDRSVRITSPVLRTPEGEGVYGSCFNAKLLSRAQALEWILVKSFL